MYNSGESILKYYRGSAALTESMPSDARSCLAVIADADLSSVTREMFELMIGFESRELDWFASTPEHELGFRLEYQMCNVEMCENTHWHDEARFPDFRPERGCERRVIGKDVVFVFDLIQHEHAIRVLEKLSSKQSLKLLLALEACRVTLDATGRMVSDNAALLFSQMQSGDVMGWL